MFIGSHICSNCHLVCRCVTPKLFNLTITPTKKRFSELILIVNEIALARNQPVVFAQFYR